MYHLVLQRVLSGLTAQAQEPVLRGITQCVLSQTNAHEFAENGAFSSSQRIMYKP